MNGDSAVVQVGTDAVEVWMSLFGPPADPAPDDVGDMISRHPAGSWPLPDASTEPLGDMISRHLTSWASDGETVERPPPGEPSPFWYTVGWGGLFYWQWAAIGAGTAILVAASGKRRR